MPERVAAVARPVGRVAHQRMRNVLEMAPDLVAPACQGLDLHQRVAARRMTAVGKRPFEASASAKACRRRQARLARRRLLGIARKRIVDLAFGLRRRKMPREEIDRRVARVAEKLGLAPFVARKPHALSGGQRQRVALGRAIVRDPKVFLFDEPLSNLDASLRVTTRNELVKQQHELGTTTIYVTHDQVEAMTMGDRICIMNKGEVVQIGKPLEVYRNPADTFVARFLGNPPMNLLAGRLDRLGAGVTLAVAGSSFEIPGFPPAALAPYADGPVTVGLRPEDLYEAPPDRSDRMPAIAARILAVEPLGAETLLMLSVGAAGEEITARIGRDTALRQGEEARLFVDSTTIHLFDPATTKAIARSR